MKQVGIILAAALLSWGMTGLILAAARHAQHLALPTARGLHAVPTPVGGGLGLIGAVVLVWAVSMWPPPPFAIIVALGLGCLALLSWFDDRAPLSPGLRLIMQALVILAVLWSLPAGLRLAPRLPVAFERIVLGLGWLWMINLTNFMDGTDGLAGVEAISVAAGYAVVIALIETGGAFMPGLAELALVVAAAAAGYLYWNWAPARIFMGDVGSIPLGFLFGLLMLDLAYRGHAAAALILPMFFVADATTTLLRRVAAREIPWHAHREHAFQRAVLGGMTHAQVATHVAVLNVALVALAVMSVKMPWTALALAAALALTLLHWLRGRSTTVA